MRELFKELEQSRAGQKANLSDEAKELIRVHLTENQDLVRELQDRLRVAQEEAEHQSRRRTDVEKMLLKRDTAYEELLDKTASSQNMAVEDIKVRHQSCDNGGVSAQLIMQKELQARFTDQEERLKAEISTLDEQLGSKAAEIDRLKGTIDEYKVSIEELNRALTNVSAGNDDGHYLASTIQEYDRLRRNNEAQHHEYENIKRNLMADLSNRCEKVSVANCPGSTRTRAEHTGGGVGDEVE
jgi:kinesin family protein 5